MNNDLWPLLQTQIVLALGRAEYAKLEAQAVADMNYRRAEELQRELDGMKADNSMGSENGRSDKSTADTA